jgi:hypothetical protein
LGKLFYWLSKAGVAAVIDPKGMSIPTLKLLSEQYENYSYLETHIHADFLQDQELAALTGTKCTFQPKADRLKYEFPHVDVKGWRRLKVGNLKLELYTLRTYSKASVFF